MSDPAISGAFAESLAQVGRCLNRGSAMALLELSANPRVQTRVDELAEKCNEGRLTSEERSEYDALIWMDHYLGFLQTEAHFVVRTEPPS